MASPGPAVSFIHSVIESKSSSALSPSVKQLLCEIGVLGKVAQNTTNHIDCERNINNVKQNHSHSQLKSNPVDQTTVRSRCQHVLCEDGFIKFDLCAKLLPKISGQPVEDYYRDSVSALAEMFRCSQDTLEDMSLEQFSHIYGESLLWTKNPQLFLECFELLTHNNGADDLLSLLLICTRLEHSLGNLFLLRGKQCPLMLKDLITARELEDILGSDVLRLLQVVMGPPISMNIRNVSWHGFLCEHELPRRYIYFLLLLTASVGSLLQGQGISQADICPRDDLPLTRTEDIANVVGVRELSDGEIKSVEECLLNSWLVYSGNINLFKSALAYHKQQQYGLCSVLLLPLLEHSLRRVFVAVNGCPHRLVTAEATSLYTTFEEILDKSLPDGRENSLVQVLGEPCMDLLHDLLIYPDGPRVRDKLGHGEADCHAVPESLPRILLVVFVWLAKLARDDLEIPVTEMFHGLSDYSSVFHPVSLLHQRILNMCTVTGTLHTDLHTSPGLESWNQGHGFEVFLNKNEMFMDMQTAFTQWLQRIAGSMGTVTTSQWEQMGHRLSMPFSDVYQDVKCMLPHKLKTLYRWQKDVYAVKNTDVGSEKNTDVGSEKNADVGSEKNTDVGSEKNADVGSEKILNSDSKHLFNSESVKVTESEIVGILSRIIAETETVLTQTRSALKLRQEQLEKKQLRSRQRENLTRLLTFLPCASLLANHVAVLSTWHVCHLDHRQSLDSRGLKTVQRFLKNTLRTCENVRTFTSSDSNKWSQAGQVLLEELKSAVKFSKLSIFPSNGIVGK